MNKRPMFEVKGQKNKKKRMRGQGLVTRRLLSAILVGAMVLPVFFYQKTSTVSAKQQTSLPHIEEIRQQINRSPEVSFHILEVTPNAGDGSFDESVTGEIGYYIEGQEPVDVDEVLSGPRYTSRTERSVWGNAYFHALLERGIASATEDAAPLTSTFKEGDTYYKEYYPWENAPEGAKTLHLVDENKRERSETVRVNGQLEQKEGGAYDASDDAYEVVTDGHYIQNMDKDYPLQMVSDIKELKEDFDAVKDQYIFYERPTFSDNLPLGEDGKLVISDSDWEAVGHKLIYSRNPDDKEPEWRFDYDATAHDYYKVGCEFRVLTGFSELPSMGRDITLNYEELVHGDYYAAKIRPNNAFKAKKAGQTGYFDLNTQDLKYVGSGKGSFDLTGITVSTNGAYQVQYDYVKYQGGYKNNNWFLRYVLDYRDSDAEELSSLSKRIHVDSLTPDRISKTMDARRGQSQDIQGYDLVAVSNGIDVFSGSMNHTGLYRNYEPRNLKQALKSYLGQRGAVVAKYEASLCFNDPLTGGTSHPNDLKPEDIHGRIYGSIYLSRTTTTQQALVTQDFTGDFEESEYKQAESGFYDVYDEIHNENILRQRTDEQTTDLLEEDINMATAIRYVINYHNQRNRGRKARLRILDVEPPAIPRNNLSDHTVTSEITEGGAASGTIKATLLKDWFDNRYKAADIDVTTVATSTLIGLTQDITEAYDVIYIGGGNRTNQTYSGDGDMNGLVYYNIGEKVDLKNQGSAGYVTSGLLDEDYEAAPKEQRYRYSGNDLTQKKADEIKSFASVGLPVIYSSLLAEEKNYPAHNVKAGFQKDVSFVLQDYGNSAKLTLTPLEEADNISYSYQWYRNDQMVVGANSKSYTVQKADFKNGTGLYCVMTSVSINGKTYTFDPQDAPRSDLIRISINGLKQSFRDTGKGAGVYYIFRWIGAEIPVASNWDNTELTVVNATERNSEWRNKSNKKIKGKTTKASDWKVGDVVQWYGELNGYVCRSNEFEVLAGIENGGGYWTEGGSKTKTLSAEAGEGIEIRPQTVDVASRLYDAMVDMAGRGNVMVNGHVDAQRLLDYANLSHPVLVYEEDGQPKPYVQEMADHNAINVSEGETEENAKLSFAFRIVNPTDPDPINTTYSARIYTDNNGDGIFSPDEEVQEGEENVGEMKGGLNYENAPVQRFDVVIDASSHPGCVPWKIVIAQNNNQSIHSSSYGISYVKPLKKVELNILQINDNYQNNYNLESMQRNNTGNYGRCLNDKAVTDVYDLRIKTVRAQDVAAVGDYKEILKYFENYDMLILGFNDMYQTLTRNTCFAIEDFADQGKSVLFSHDCSSFTNMNKQMLRVFYGGDFFSESFDFNTILRSRSYLDQYGISDTNLHARGSKEYQFGGTKYWETTDRNGDSIDSGILAEKRKLTADEIEALKSENYSIAYKPKSGSTSLTTTGETQGFTNNLLNRYKDGRDRFTQTNRVKQVNTGQITSYPFDLNGHTNGELDISVTHGQYYQLNMNSDNIVVWYTLSGDNFQDRDGMNEYYIYSANNITYTGAGHSSNPTLDEAKLFVNTMVASRRDTIKKPKASFVASAKDDTEISSTYILQDQKGNTAVTMQDQKVYFKVEDDNLVSSRKISVQFYYESASLDHRIDDVTIYRAKDDEVVYKLHSGTIYYIMLPPEVLAELTENNSAKLVIMPITHYGNSTENDQIGEPKTLTVQKTGMFDLG